MTDKPDLPPSSVTAFTEALKGERGLLDAWLEVNDEREVAAHIEAYASANVAHVTAAKDAEIDALRAEAERLHEQLRLATVDQAAAEAEANDAHAENKRLAEALECMIIGACAVAVPHNGERSVLQDAVNIARAALAAYRKGGKQ